MKILNLQADNYKRIQAIDITPDQFVQVIGGKNAQGKTSVLDSIWSAFAGGEASKAIKKPVREGAESAEVRVDLGEFVVIRKWDESGKTTLTVESSLGAKFSSPQSMLDNLLGKMSFDPLAFTRLKPAEQREVLLGLVKLDINLEALDIKYKNLYAERTEIGRDVKATSARIEGYWWKEGELDAIPDEELTSAEVIAQFNAGKTINDKREDAIARLVSLRQQLEILQNDIRELESEFAMMPDEVPLDDLATSLEAIEETNKLVRRKKEYLEVVADGKNASDSYEMLDVALTAITNAKREALEKAEFPIEGLAFDDDGITFNGIPFDQVSASEQIKVSLAMAMALNPKIRVIRILDGSLLDEDSLAVISEMAHKNDFQVWIETVGDNGVGVIIEDGKVK